METKYIILEKSFFKNNVIEVAPLLLGKYLVRELDNGMKLALMINEVEAYQGEHDLASHARFGRTKRNEPMFGPGGHFYVYLIYGIYWMLNIVTGNENEPSGVLIRGAGEIIGPGRLTNHLKINKCFYGIEAIPENKLWFEDRKIIIPSSKIIQTPRIGIDYAGKEWAEKPLRFLIKP